MSRKKLHVWCVFVEDETSKETMLDTIYTTEQHAQNRVARLCGVHKRIAWVRQSVVNGATEIEGQKDKYYVSTKVSNQRENPPDDLRNVLIKVSKYRGWERGWHHNDGFWYVFSDLNKRFSSVFEWKEIL